MTIKQLPKFSPPAGATPNELAATGPGSAAAQEWQTAHAQSLVLQQSSTAEAEARAQQVSADRLTLVLPAFRAHVRALPKPIGPKAIGAVVAPVGVAAWQASRWDGDDGGKLARRILATAPPAAVLGYLLGRFIEHATGPSRAPVSLVLPLDVETTLHRKAPDAPQWRLEGWAESWADLAAQYEAGVMPPTSGRLGEVFAAAAREAGPVGRIGAALLPPPRPAPPRARALSGRELAARRGAEMRARLDRGERR